MWAIVNCIHRRAHFPQLPQHFLMYFPHQRFREISPRHARLIRNHDHRKSRFVQLPNRFCGSGQHVKALQVIHVAHVFRNRSITVQKNGAPQYLTLTQTAPPAPRTMSLSPHSPFPPSPASCSDDRSGTAAKSTGCNTASPAQSNSSASLARSPGDRSVRKSPPPANPPPRPRALRPNRCPQINHNPKAVQATPQLPSSPLNPPACVSSPRQSPPSRLPPQVFRIKSHPHHS